MDTPMRLLNIVRYRSARIRHIVSFFRGKYRQLKIIFDYLHEKEIRKLR